MLNMIEIVLVKMQKYRREMKEGIMTEEKNKKENEEMGQHTGRCG